MSRILIVAGALAICGAGVLPAAAQDAAPGATPPAMSAPEPQAAAPGPSHRLTGAAVMFNMLDEDRSGTIGMDEAAVLFETLFVTLDGDENGELSKDEINAALERFYGRGGRDGKHGYHRGRRDAS